MTNLLHKFIFLLILGITLPVLTCGCSEDSVDSSAGVGKFNLGIEIDNRLYTPSGEEVSGWSIPAPPVGDVTVYMRDESGRYSNTWPKFDDFTQNADYFIGQYTLAGWYGSEELEGFDSPFFYGQCQAVVTDRNSSLTTLVLRPVSCAVKVDFSSALTDYFSGVTAELHSDGGEYFTVTPSEERLLYLNPGVMTLYVTAVLPDGRPVRFAAAGYDEAKSGVLYELSIGFVLHDDVPVVVVEGNGQTNEIELTEQFISAEAPVITPVGWASGIEMELPEGDAPSATVAAEVSFGDKVSHLYLSTRSASLILKGVPPELDLCNLATETSQLLSSLGLSVEERVGGLMVDFTDFLGNLVYLTPPTSVSTFALMCVDNAGRASEPSTLVVKSTPVEIEVLSANTSIIGVNIGEIIIRSSAPGFTRNVAVEVQDADGNWEQATIIDIQPKADATYLVRFGMPEGTGAVNARVLYCDEPRASVVVERVMPAFDIEVDAFANYAAVRIVPEDATMLKFITETIIIYVNGERGSIFERYPESGMVGLVGLVPSTTYEFKATMMERPDEDDFTPAVKVKTETTPQLPNADFEERKGTIRFDNLPSGGRYSQTNVEIFNWQNHATYIHATPEEWANVNSKTINRSAKNQNTWYMQPSTYTVTDCQSGEFAVLLRSVAYDIDGPEIDPYVQESEPYINYSRVIPRIANRAAGKLFIGSYSFDAASGEEKYNEGMGWNARPMSLNGFYKYQPGDDDKNDVGLVEVEVIGEILGEEKVISHAVKYLPIATGYTAFSVPLDYEYFGVKATRIKVMFASSRSIGTIAEESASIVTTPDPVTAASVGSQLWLDNVTLAY